VIGGFTIDDFTIDTAAGTVTCPNQITVHITRSGAATFGAKCRGCALRQRCTASPAGRTIRVREHHELLTAARAHALTAEFIEPYQQHRPMVERSIAWLVRRGRKVRYRGIGRNQIGLAHRCAAINLTRLVNLGLHHSDGTWQLATG
jgi:Transposase DDE domain